MKQIKVAALKQVELNIIHYAKKINEYQDRKDLRNLFCELMVAAIQTQERLKGKTL